MAARILSATLLVLTASLLVPAAAADEVDTPPVGVPSTVAPSCVVQVNSRIHVFCASGTSTLCVQDTTCVGSSPNGACSQLSALVQVCVSRQTVGGGEPVVPAQHADTCIAYNAAALSNACVNSGSQNRTVPAVSFGSDDLCVVGNVCGPVPEPVVGEQSVTGPAPNGYVEATRLCPVTAPLSAPCRADF